MIDFPGKEKDEKVMMVIHKHWTAIILHLFLYLVYFAIPIAAYFIVSQFLIAGISEFPYLPLIILVISLYYIFWWFGLLKGWIDYYLDAWIITDRRLIDMEQKGFFSHTVAELRLDKIQDVQVEIKGFIPSMFHFGTIKVQTAAAVQLFNLEDIPDPEKMRNLILDMQDKMARRPMVYENMETKKPA